MPPVVKKGKESPSSGGTSSTPAPDTVLGPFAADCANAALRDEVKKIYAAIFKKVAAKEGLLRGEEGSPSFGFAMSRRLLATAVI